ncbi:MAG: hypothetical protein A2808_02620 [Candidatus Moranbacteria bacterium RIFCSPHIGHO2_01_FULL_55_24]|nr:MAG: hypothetical protein A2808_02620 [Candidatus Moranbacteria bacterium RIFCSPHIGHO2_01_FULL_55_24]
MKRKALLLLWYGAPRQNPSFIDKICRFDPRNREFLIRRDKETGRYGFISFDLLPGESVMAGLRRQENFTSQAFKREWRELGRFPHVFGDEPCEMLVGDLLVHSTQRLADFQEDNTGQPLLWENYRWLCAKQQDDLLDTVSGIALCLDSVRNFFQGEREALPA